MAEPQRPAGRGREILLRLFRRGIAAALLFAALVYGADYLILRYRMAENRSAFGTITVRPYYAVPRKDHKTEFLFGDPQDETCVNSLFPHAGDSPCWYLVKHRDKRIDM